MRTLDLHGRTIHDAWKLFIAFAYEKWLDKEKHVRVITGHGAIQKEFPRWCEACVHVRKCETEPVAPWAVSIFCALGGSVRVD